VHEASGFDVVLGDEQADAIAVLVPRDLGRELERAYSCLRSDLACVLGRQRQIPVSERSERRAKRAASEASGERSERKERISAWGSRGLDWGLGIERLNVLGHPDRAIGEVDGQAGGNQGRPGSATHASR
jgi:hypothetical protein